MNASRNITRLTRQIFAVGALATFSVLLAEPALAQPYPAPVTASPALTVVSASGSEKDVLDARPDAVAQEAERCPTDVRMLVADLLLAGLGAHAANYAVYVITDDCAEAID